MLKRHQDALENRLEDVLHHGFAHVLWSEVYRWYGVERIAANTWRDIVARWEEIASARHHGALMRVDAPGGVVFVAEKSVKPIIP